MRQISIRELRGLRLGLNSPFQWHSCLERLSKVAQSGYFLCSTNMSSSEVPTPGHFIPPSPTTWRRERLLHIGSNSTMPSIHPNDDGQQQVNEEVSDISLPAPLFSETTALRQPNRQASYGSIPTPRLVNRPSLSFRQSLSRVPGLQNLNGKSHPSSPLESPSTPRYSILKSQRPISAYDAPLKDSTEQGTDARVNGIRVWYSSFTSIDWLHDAIKDSARFARLRRRPSLRSRIRLLIDRGLGWFIVTVVGFLTACVAFLVVRSEQWLFDLKEGFCGDAWYKAKRFCCFQSHTGNLQSPWLVESGEFCPAWRTWSEVFDQTGAKGEMVDYLSWTAIALVLAGTSCFLTVLLSDSTTFTTRKESGVLKPEFADHQTPIDPSLAPKRKVMYYAAGSGVPEIKTILSGFVIHGYLGGRVLFTKAVGLPMAVASGLSLGKEGPFVHIGSCIGNIVSRIANKYENNEGMRFTSIFSSPLMMKLLAKRREILSAACAAGVAVAFGAPIGGTLFSLEEVSYFFPPKVMWRSFFCAMVAAITLKMLDPFGTGKVVLFQVTYDKDWRAFELIPFIILGIFGGVYGAYFSKLNYRWGKHVRNKTWLIRHPLLEVLLITSVTTLLCFLNPFTRMGGPELVYNLFSECRPDYDDNYSLGLCLADRGSAEQAWRVSQFPAVFLSHPWELVLARAGYLAFGFNGCNTKVLNPVDSSKPVERKEIVGLFNSSPDTFDSTTRPSKGVIPGLYAMVGAAASLSGVTRTTVSLAVIMFELTDTLTYAVPVMLAVLVAKTVADALEPKGIYELVIELNQLPFLDSKHEYLWGNLQINDVTSRDVDTIQLEENNTVMSLRDKLLALNMAGNEDSGFPILRKDANEDGSRMVGYIGASELEHALSIVADADADREVRFQANYTHNLAASSVSSLLGNHQQLHSDADPFDFSIYMDQAPLTISSNSPMELLHQFFVKLGARYVVITDSEGLYEGAIDKKTWLAFLSHLEEKS
ncbi:hypothetical protein D9756_005341 [Leucocoprinus leucothites]|uniref:Chloride channel protein n=1 Tax=Leucocoprinus leucothites TaxID=201217 RepID=A0A8H5D9F2_9AGAR|nr:hypothetical protein D9756_005341 [Leucoagaricus leucothites]